MARDVIAGKHINKMKDKNGQQMTDSYLVKKIGEYFEFVPQVYKYTSGYIHFSERHLFDGIWNINEEQRIVNYIINERDQIFPESSWIELVNYAIYCLKIIENFPTAIWRVNNDR